MRRVPRAHRTLYMLLALAGWLVVCATPGTSAMAAVHGAPPTTADPAETRTSELYKEASIAYRIGDYAKAISLLTDGFKVADEIKDLTQRRRALKNLTFNLAKAHRDAYFIDRDVQHLRIAQRLVTKVLKMEADEDKQSDLADLLASIDEALASAEQEANNKSVAGNEVSSNTDDTASTTPGRDGVRVEDAVADDPADSLPDGGQAAPTSKEKRNRRADRSMSPMKMSAITSIAIAGGGLGVMGAGFAIAGQAQNDFDTGTTKGSLESAKQRGRTGNILTVAGAASAVVFAATGATLWILDKKKKRPMAVVPGFTPGSVTLTVGAKF